MQEVVGQGVGIIVDWFIDDSDKKNILIGQVQDNEQFTVPSGTHNMVYSFGGDNPKAVVTDITVPSQQTTTIEFSPGTVTSGDTIPPSTPTGLTATAVSSTQIDLSWTASTDNTGVAGYNIYRGGTFLKAVTTTFTSDTGLNPSTQYCYTVLAYDGAGNESGQSSSVCATTLYTPDTEPPTIPTGLIANAVSTSQIDLSWAASTDNVGVAGYNIYRGGVYLKSVATGISTSDTGLGALTQYCYTVSAYDAAGQESGHSSEMCATTQANISPWPMFGHDAQHTGRSPYAGVQASALNYRWIVGAGDVVANEVLETDITIDSNGTIYAFDGGPSGATLYAIDSTGSTKWWYEVKDVIGYNIAAYGPPTVGKDDTVYIADDSGFIHAINPSDGTLKWKTTTSYCSYLYVKPMTIANDGTVYGVCFSVLFALNPDGSYKWTYNPPGYTYLDDLSPALGADGTIYIGTCNNSDSTECGLRAINADGSYKWAYSTGMSPLLSPAVGPDGTIYFGTYYNFYAIRPDGSLRWSLSRSGYYSVSIPSIATDGTIYLMDAGILYAFNPSDGSTKWQLSISGFTTYGLPSLTIDADGTIYVGTNDYLYAINPDGSVKWSYYVLYDNFSSPKIGSDGSLYVPYTRGIKAFRP